MEAVISGKEIERIQLERFGVISGLLPQGTIEERESPDFLVHTKEKVIGIELTTIYHKQHSGERPRQAWENLINKILDRLNHTLKKTNLPPCWASIHFVKSSMRKIAVGHCADKLFNAIVSNYPAIGQTVSLGEVNNQNTLLPYVSEIRLARLPEIAEWHVTAPHSLFVPDLDDQIDLRAAIFDKDNKVVHYKKSCDEIWLLINVGVGSASTRFEVSEGLECRSFSSRFDRIFLMDHFSLRYWELSDIPYILL